jgi:hypothetical protein
MPDSNTGGHTLRGCGSSCCEGQLLTHVSWQRCGDAYQWERILERRFSALHATNKRRGDAGSRALLDPPPVPLMLHRLASLPGEVWRPALDMFFDVLQVLLVPVCGAAHQHGQRHRQD